MRRRAFNARWLAAALPACGSGRMQLDRSAPWSRPRGGQARSRPRGTRQISEHAQEAIDRGDYEQARLELLQLATEAPASAEAQQRLGMVLQLEGRLTGGRSLLPCRAAARPRLCRGLDRAGTG